MSLLPKPFHQVAAKSLGRQLFCSSQRRTTTGKSRNLEIFCFEPGALNTYKIIMPLNTSKYLETLSKDDLKKIWRTADCVCFDVDSTVVKEEGIDELAEFCGAGEAVKQW